MYHTLSDCLLLLLVTTHAGIVEASQEHLRTIRLVWIDESALRRAAQGLGR